LFTRFVRPLIAAITQSKLGCNIGGLFVNLLADADDMVLLSPSWRAMQALIKLLELFCTKLDIVCNTNKTVCMIFKPKSTNMMKIMVLKCVNAVVVILLGLKIICCRLLICLIGKLNNEDKMRIQALVVQWVWD